MPSFIRVLSKTIKRDKRQGTSDASKENAPVRGQGELDALKFSHSAPVLLLAPSGQRSTTTVNLVSPPERPPRSPLRPRPKKLVKTSQGPLPTGCNVNRPKEPNWRNNTITDIITQFPNVPCRDFGDFDTIRSRAGSTMTTTSTTSTGSLPRKGILKKPSSATINCSPYDVSAASFFARERCQSQRRF